MQYALVEMSVDGSVRLRCWVSSLRCGAAFPHGEPLPSTPPGLYGKREPQIILKTEERSIHLELGRERKFNPQIKRLG